MSVYAVIVIRVDDYLALFSESPKDVAPEFTEVFSDTVSNARST